MCYDKETGIIVLVSILVCAFIIFNARDLIEDFAVGATCITLYMGNFVGTAAGCCTFILLAGASPGCIFSDIPVTQVFRRYTDGKGWNGNYCCLYSLPVCLLSWDYYWLR